MPNIDENVDIVCVFTYNIYDKTDRSYCVYNYRNRETDKVFTAVGSSLPNEKNLPVKLVGQWTTNRKNGQKQFAVKYSEKVRPTQKNEVIAYFKALRCGVGKIKATLIYNEFGEDTWNILDNEPDQLETVKGISHKLCEKIKEAVAADNVSRDLLALFGKAGITVQGSTVSYIVDKFGKDSVEKIKVNPYSAYDKGGLTFDKADAIATYLGFPNNNPERLKAVVRHALSSASQSGHVCLPKDLLLDEMVKFSKCTKDECKAAVNTAFKDGQIKTTSGYIYTLENYEQETTICKELTRLMRAGVSSVSDVDALIEEYETTHFKLADSQKDAVRQAFASQVSVITGGPGTGKTTVTNAVLYVHELVYGLNSNPVLLAPTGKASRRMSEATNHPAATIHSAVGWRGDEAVDECNDDKLDGNLFIVDEASMMDQNIAAILLKKIPSDARIVFVGDIDQLPSVGCGYVLHDLIVSKVIPVTKLNVIFRQAGTNPIVANAHAINEGKTDLIETNSFKFIETHSEGESFAEACKLYVRCVRAYGMDSVVLLNPQRNGTDLSVDNFNKKLQELLNPPDPSRTEITVQNTIFRIGDKVMELKNTATSRNGDIGYIREIYFKADPEDPSIVTKCAGIEFNDDGLVLEYDPEDLKHVTHAWCTTVHKSQGSEYPTVIQIVSKAHPSMLKRNLVYTGITRAKVNVALIGERDALKIAIENNAQEQRYTLLALRLNQAMGEFIM